MTPMPATAICWSGPRMSVALAPDEVEDGAELDLDVHLETQAVEELLEGRDDLRQVLLDLRDAGDELIDRVDERAGDDEQGTEQQHEDEDVDDEDRGGARQGRDESGESAASGPIMKAMSHARKKMRMMSPNPTTISQTSRMATRNATTVARMRSASSQRR